MDTDKDGTELCPQTTRNDAEWEDGREWRMEDDEGKPRVRISLAAFLRHTRVLRAHSPFFSESVFIRVHPWLKLNFRGRVVRGPYCCNPNWLGRVSFNKRVTAEQAPVESRRGT